MWHHTFSIVSLSWPVCREGLSRTRQGFLSYRWPPGESLLGCEWEELNFGPCRRAEGQADNSRSVGAVAQLWGRSCNLLSFYLAFINLFTAHMHTAVQLCTALMFVYSVQSVLCCTEILYSTIFLSFYLAVTSVQFVLFVLLYSTNVHRCTNKPACTTSAVTWPVVKITKPLPHLFQLRWKRMRKRKRQRPSYAERKTCGSQGKVIFPWLIWS